MEERSSSADTVQCGICRLQGSTSLHQHWEDLKIVAPERDQLAAQANQVLSPKIKRYQMCLAQRAMASEHAAVIAEERKLLLAELEQDRQRLTRLRTNLSKRKETLKLSMARFQVSKMNGPPAIANSISRIKDRWASAHQKLGHSRRVLVAELVTLFDLKCVPERRRNPVHYDLSQSTLSTATTEAPGSPSTKDGSRRTKLRVRDYLEEDSWNEYLIVGRPLPTGYFENYDRDEINTTIENVIHMMTLVACYLGIKLPYDTSTRQSRYYIQAAFTAGSKRAPLFLSENNIMLFAAGLGHLNYNIAYLCHSQGVQVTLANATNTLENLLACCEAPNLGRYTNYAAIMTKRSEETTESKGSTDEATRISSSSDDRDFREVADVNEFSLWCPGQEPFDLNVLDLIALIRSRQEEESPVWGGLHLQDTVAANLETVEDDDFMYDDQEEEDGMYTLEAADVVQPLRTGKSGPISGSNSTAVSSMGSSLQPLGDSSSPINPHHQRRSPHPSRDRRQSNSDQSQPQPQSRNLDSTTPASQGQPENWTFLDVDIFRVPSSANKGLGLLSGRVWPDMSVLKKVGSAVGGAAAGLVNGATSVAGGMSPRLAHGPRDRFTPGGESSFPTISSSAP
ncbi:hypothetical protein BGZ58_002994 [Dissophora ornata]|nr:hypothetical protein BGZ58_002994 [Dissophora ornata]